MSYPGPVVNGTVGANPVANIELSGLLSHPSLLFQMASKSSELERNYRDEKTNECS